VYPASRAPLVRRRAKAEYLSRRRSTPSNRVAHVDVLPEPERLTALRGLALANLEPEEPFDRLTRLATAACSAPTALLTFAGPDFEHLKSSVGLPERLTSLRRVPLGCSIARLAGEGRRSLVVSDTSRHPVLRKSQAVTELGVASYAGAPLLTSEGHCLGTICVLDWKPREWTAGQVASLEDLAAAALAELEHRSLIENTSDIIVIVEESGVVRYANPTVEPVLGYSPRELVGRDGAELVHPEARARVLKAHREALRDPGRARRGVEFRVRHKDGGWCVLEVLASVPRYRTAGPEAVLTLRDVTERRRAEAALRESEERLRLTLDAGKCGLWDWDIQADRVTWSERVYEMHGLTPETFRGRREDFARVIHPDDAPRVREAIRQALEERAEYGIEFRVVHPTGETRWVWSNGEVLFGDDGTPLRMVGATLDTTERRRAEEALRASHEQLRQLARRLDDVREEELTRVSREIHDELGHALTALRLDLAWLIPKLSRNREAVRLKAAEMLALVDDTIDAVRRIAARLRPPVLEDLGLAAAIEARLARLARQTGLHVELRADAEDVPKPLRRALDRIAQEALTNVARHAGAARVRVVLERRPDGFVLEIADDGVGMPAGTIGNPRALGMVGMRERAASIGADFQVSAGPRGGTTIRVTGAV
jgi:two-component system, NarL family, sensor histidine kinase UhpB